MQYTLHQLQVFVTITETESVTKAAARLNLTQPAVSIQLKNLQDQFDIPLTEVIGRKLFITSFGKKIAATARRILKEMETIEQQVLAHKGLLAGTLRFSVVTTGVYVMPYFLEPFIRRHPGIDLIMDVTNKKMVLEALENNETDFALVSVLPTNVEVYSIELMHNELFLVGGKEFAPASGRKKPVSILSDLPLIFREEGSGTQLTVEKFLQKEGIAVHRKMELATNEAVKQAVLAGLGYSIMPLIGIGPEITSGTLTIVPVKGLPLKTNWNLIWLKGKSLSPAASAYLHFLQKEKDLIAKNHFNWVKS